jgi:glc operon protein GlcG
MGKIKEQIPPSWKEGQLGYQSGLTLKMSQKMLNAAEKEAGKQEVPVSMAITDSGGNLVAFRRMDNAILLSIFQSGGLPVLSFHENLIALPGGFPIVKEGKLFGGIGISGGVAKHDIMIARAALAEGGFSLEDADAALKEMEC